MNFKSQRAKFYPQINANSNKSMNYNRVFKRLKNNLIKQTRPSPILNYKSK